LGLTENLKCPFFTGNNRLKHAGLIFLVEETVSVELKAITKPEDVHFSHFFILLFFYRVVLPPLSKPSPVLLKDF